MGDLNTLHKAARALIFKVRDGVSRLERTEKTGDTAEAAGISKDLHQKLQELDRLGTEMDSIHRMQALTSSSTSTNMWRRKINTLLEEADDLKKSIERHQYRQTRRRAEEAERNELLTHGTDGRDFARQMDADVRAQRHVQNSKQMVQEMLDSGATILVDMSGQRDRLKMTHKKMLDVLNSIGLSDSLMRIIERRQFLDKLIVYGGMGLLLLLVILLVWWRKG